MKRILAAFAVLFLAALLAVPAFGAGASTTATGAPVRNGWYVVTVSITADDATGAIDDLTISSTSNASIYRELLGSQFYGLHSYTNHTGTEVVDDTDVYVYHAVGAGTKVVDLLGAKGVDAIDNASNQSILGYSATTADTAAFPIYDTVTVTVTQAAGPTNSATLTMDLLFKK